MAFLLRENKYRLAIYLPDFIEDSRKSIFRRNNVKSSWQRGGSL